jgi:geranylgeranyl pyrophosphate synthase
VTDNQALRGYRERIEGVLERLLATDDPQAARLIEAMRYSALGGGKRLRPCLVYGTGQALGADLGTLDSAAAAVELIHVYSLIHDDLPAMDDDDLRRGRPSCHRAFDEATAILAGDALQALAFGVLGGRPALGTPTAPALAVRMIGLLAERIGTRGMAGGQAIDLGAVGHSISSELLADMHTRKTGALIEASVLLGATAAGVLDGPVFEGLQRFGRDVGLAFQIQDDILDVDGVAETMGKAAGADARLAKPTWPSIHGLAAARAAADQLRRSALIQLGELPFNSSQLGQLQAITRFVVDRSH